jgi:Cytochrome P450
MGQEMNAVTQRVMLETLFGQGIDRSEMGRLGDDIQLAFASLNVRVLLYFLPERFPLPGERRYRAAIAAIDEAILRLVRARRASAGDRHDLLSVLLRARDADTGEGMNDRQLRDELVTMFVGGQETTAIAMTWLWYVLDQYPEVDRRLRAEVANVLGDRRPTFADLARLTYTKQVTDDEIARFFACDAVPIELRLLSVVDGRLPQVRPRFPGDKGATPRRGAQGPRRLVRRPAPPRVARRRHHPPRGPRGDGVQPPHGLPQLPARVLDRSRRGRYRRAASDAPHRPQ